MSDMFKENSILLKYIFIGEHTAAAIFPTIVNTTNEAISRFDPNTRGCYVDEEFHFKTLTWNAGYRYSLRNCLFASLIEKVVANCSCMPNYYNGNADDYYSIPFCR